MVSLQPVEPAAGPAPRGPYSAGIRAGGLLFVSGQIAIAPDGRSLADADLETQTRQCLANLRAVLDAGGATLQQVAKVTVYMAEPDGWPLFNRLYAEFFGPHRPARAIVPVPAFPGGFKVERAGGLSAAPSTAGRLVAAALVLREDSSPFAGTGLLRIRYRCPGSASLLTALSSQLPTAFTAE